MSHSHQFSDRSIYFCHISSHHIKCSIADNAFCFHQNTVFQSNLFRYTLQRCGDYTPLPEQLKDAITIGKIKEAQNLITERQFIRNTPVINGITINGIGKDCILSQLESFSMKCENMQFSGGYFLVLV